MNWLRSIDLTLPYTLLAQVAPEGGEAPPAGAAGGGGAAQPESFSQFLLSPLNFMLMLFMLFFLLVLWPQQRQMKAQQKALADALANLKKNDRVITTGGIHGTVVQAPGEAATVTLKIDEGSGAKMTVSREAIARVVAGDGKASDTKAT